MKFFQRSYCMARSLSKVKKVATSSRFLSSQTQPNFGICLDLDGVLKIGEKALPHAKEVVQRLQNRVPLVFVTNALSRDAWKAYQLGEMLGVKVLSEQMVQSQGPLAMFPHYFHKHCLLVGQGPLNGIAEDLGFTKTHWMEDVALAYPLLDVVDHQRGYEMEKVEAKEYGFPQIEAIILMGEPKKWETCLQLCIDLLLTEGKPVHTATRQYRQTLPVILCNGDLQYAHVAAFPRYGNGAFVACLETLFKKITGQVLAYEAVMGKPSEITMRFAEHCLSRDAERMGIQQPLRTMYMVGDNREVDILGANLYQSYISHCQSPSSSPEYSIPASRLPPPTAQTRLLPQTVDSVCSVLVETGVSTRGGNGANGDIVIDHSHREFLGNLELTEPTVIVDNVLQAVEYIMLEENFS